MLKQLQFKIAAYYFVVFILGVSSYFVAWQLLDIEISSEQMFDNFSEKADSYSYLQVADWIFDRVPTDYVAVRPFLFPLIIGVLYKLGGVYLLWIFQLLCYSVAHVVLHKALKMVTSSYILAWLGSLLFLSNFSLVGLSFHALTELLVILGLAVFVYLHAKWQGSLTKDHHSIISKWTILLGILTLVKPVFFYLFLAGAGYLIIVFLRKKLVILRSQKVALGIVILLILVQCSIVRMYTDSFNVSVIGKETFRKYLVAQTYQELHQNNRINSLLAVEDMSNADVSSFVKSNFKRTVRMFYYNIVDNIQSVSYVENYKDEEENAFASQFMRTYNYFLLYVLIGIAVLITVQAVYAIKAELRGGIILFGILGILAYLVIVSGIASNQRDRLIVITLPLWIYLLLGAFNFGNIFRGYWLQRMEKNEKNS